MKVKARKETQQSELYTEYCSTELFMTVRPKKNLKDKPLSDARKLTEHRIFAEQFDVWLFLGSTIKIPVSAVGLNHLLTDLTVSGA